MNEYTSEEILIQDVEAIVKGVISRFPSFIQGLLEPYINPLSAQISRVSERYVDAKIAEDRMMHWDVKRTNLDD